MQTAKHLFFGINGLMVLFFWNQAALANPLHQLEHAASQPAISTPVVRSQEFYRFQINALQTEESVLNNARLQIDFSGLERSENQNFISSDFKTHLVNEHGRTDLNTEVAHIQILESTQSMATIELNFLSQNFQAEEVKNFSLSLQNIQDSSAQSSNSSITITLLPNTDQSLLIEAPLSYINQNINPQVAAETPETEPCTPSPEKTAALERIQIDFDQAIENIKREGQQKNWTAAQINPRINQVIADSNQRLVALLGEECVLKPINDPDTSPESQATEIPPNTPPPISIPEKQEPPSPATQETIEPLPTQSDSPFDVPPDAGTPTANPQTQKTKTNSLPKFDRQRIIRIVIERAKKKKASMPSEKSAQKAWLKKILLDVLQEKNLLHLVKKNKGSQSQKRFTSKSKRVSNSYFRSRQQERNGYQVYSKK